jgi:acetoin utilization deacetylase AcuC-like enzyme
MIKIGTNNSSKHYSSIFHFEKPDRTEFCIEYLKKNYINSIFIQTSDCDYDALEKIIKLAHSENHINQIKNLRTNFLICRNCNGKNTKKTKRTFTDFIESKINCHNCNDYLTLDNTYCFISNDTYFTGYSFQIAIEGIGTIKLLLDGMDKKESIYSLAIIRPPGHHCNNDPNGFCIFNNVYVGAKYAQTLGFKKILILDVDFHHGDGTQGLLENDSNQDSNNNISFVSIHGYGEMIYPGTGKNSLQNKNILNIPLEMTRDKESRNYITDEYYQNILTTQVFPFIQEQNPDLIIVSLGFDAHQNDPLEGMNITDETYLFLTEKLKNLSKPILFVLEGGYNVKTIARVVNNMVGLLGTV